MNGVWQQVPTDGLLHAATRDAVLALFEGWVSRVDFRVPDRFHSDLDALSVLTARRLGVTEAQVQYYLHSDAQPLVSVIASGVAIDSDDLYPPFYGRLDFTATEPGLITQIGVVQWLNVSFTKRSLREHQYPNTAFYVE